MGRVTVDQIEAGLLHEPTGETALVARYLVSPVRPPVQGGHGQVALPADPLQAPAQFSGGFSGQLGEEGDPGLLPARGPLPGHAGRGRGQGEHQNAALTAVHGDGRRGPGLLPVGTGSGRTDARRPQRLQRLAQTRTSPVQDVVVGQDGHVDAGGGQASDVGRMGPVMNSLAGPGVLAGGDRRLQVHDPGGGPRAGVIEDLQGVAPRILEADRGRDRPVLALRQLDVSACVLHVRLVERRGDRVREDLVEAAADHHVAGQEEPDGAGVAGVLPDGPSPVVSRLGCGHGSSPDGCRRPPPTLSSGAFPTESERRLTLRYRPWKM